MTATGSANLLPVKDFYQPISTNFPEKHNVDFITLRLIENKEDVQLQIINRLADCTSDGGALTSFRVGPDCSQSIPAFDSIRYELYGTALFDCLNQSSVEVRRFTYQATFARHNDPIYLEHNLPHVQIIEWIKAETGLSQERIGQLVGVSRQTINGWKRGLPIADQNRKRLLAVRDVFQRAKTRYPTPAALITWLDTPHEVSGQTPAQLLEANEINRVRLLALSSAPSSRLIPPPPWVNRPIPPAFRAGAERRQEALPHDIDNTLSTLIDDEGEDNLNEDGEVLPRR